MSALWRDSDDRASRPDSSRLSSLSVFSLQARLQ